MKTTFISNLQRFTAFNHGKTREEISYLKLSITKGLAVIALLFMVSWNAIGQTTPCNTYVKEVYNVGLIEPRIFKDPSSSNYYLTARTNDSTFISGLDGAGNFIWTNAIQFPNDLATITDLIVDQVDGTLAGIARGVNNNIMFKYNYTTATFDWVELYPINYLFQNIHQVSSTTYVVTGEVLGARMTIFQVNRVTGQMFGYGYQREGVTGEFLSTYDGTDIYGACRYYTNSGSMFNPSLFRYSAATGTNLWTKTYVRNFTPTMRIYPVAPIVDGGRLLQLSSGSDVAFNTYQSGPTKVWLLQTDLGGVLNWTNEIVIPGYTQLNVKKIINTATGYYLLIDSYNGSSAIIDYFFVVKTDKSGKVQWANRYGISGQNTVLSGVEENGYLYLTAITGSYTSAASPLLLKLDPNGMSDPNCNYIKKVQAFESTYANTTDIKPTPTNPTNWAETPGSDIVYRKKPLEKVFCATTCQLLPCQTLTGTLATGVLAFYPFGYGSLLDLGGGGYDLTNPTSAFPTPDRAFNPTCAYRFTKTNGDFLTRTASSFLNGLTTSPFSISLWYQPIGPRGLGDYELLIGRGTTTTGLHCPDTWGQWSVGLYDCRRAMVGFDMNSHWEGTAGYPSCAAQLAGVTGFWHHFAFVYNGSGGYDIYVDGILSSNVHGPCGFMSGNIDPLMLGVDYTGDLDDIVIYNRAITPAEVIALMGLPASCCDGVTSANKTGNNDPEQIKGLNTTDIAGAIKIYPNPTDGDVSISAGNATIRSVAVYSNTGALIKTYTFDAHHASVNMDNMASGIYFLKVITDTGSTIQKVVKN